MFRLDYLNADGTIDVEVTTPETGAVLRPRHMTTARVEATLAAELSEVPVLISRVVGDATKPTLVVDPDGSSRRPAGTEASNPRDTECKADTGVPCFCLPCREARKAQR